MPFRIFYHYFSSFDSGLPGGSRGRNALLLLIVTFPFPFTFDPAKISLKWYDFYYSQNAEKYLLFTFMCY